MQTKIEGNKIGCSKSFSEATPEEIERARKHGWDVEVMAVNRGSILLRRFKNGQSV